MQNRKTIFFIGFLIFLLPVLGFPGSWEAFIEVVSGLVLMFLAARKTLEKRMVKNKKVVRKREKGSPVSILVTETSAQISTTLNTASEPEDAGEVQ